MLYVIGLLISVLAIVAHEFGHLFAARLFKVPVDEFCIGLGPLVWSQARPGRTKYFVKAVPVSGLIRLDPASEGLRWLPVFLAGPVVNLVLAVLLMYVSGAVSGRSNDTFARLARWDYVDRTDGFSFAASISRSYGILNLLPLVGFDGGQSVILIGRLLTQRRKHHDAPP